MYIPVGTPDITPWLAIIMMLSGILFGPLMWLFR